MDPPAYTLTTPAPPTTTRRSIEDTRALILSNATLLASRLDLKDPTTISLLLAKAPPPSLPDTSSGTRSFTHSASNVTIRLAPSPEPSAGNSAGERSRRNSVARERQQGRHYAILVAKGRGAEIAVILKGEAQESVEEALEWMLDRTESVVGEMVERHGRVVKGACCTFCERLLGATSTS